MSRLARVLQKVFGSAAAPNEIAEFGSFAAGTPTYTTDPLAVQGLGNFLTGWFGAVIGGNSPAIEDMNALHFLFSYQLAYLLQLGVPEYSATTQYYKGSLVNDGNGNVFTCLTNSSIGQPLTDVTKWRMSTTPATGPDILIGNPAVFPYSTHASLNDAVADSNVGTNQRVLLLESVSMTATQNLTKAGWDITAVPGVTYSDGVGIHTGISVQADGITIRNMRFAGFSTAAIAFSVLGTYGRVNDCRFATDVPTGVDYSAVPAGKTPSILGAINEV